LNQKHSNVLSDCDINGKTDDDVEFNNRFLESN
jgi:hypothetical protein